MAREAVRLGFFLGISGVVTCKNARKLVEVVQEIPLEHLLVETDAPDLAPVPFRGKRNQSSDIRHVLERIAAIQEISVEEVARATSANARRFLRLA